MRPPALPSLTIHHFSIAVPDIEVALRWYEDILGFKPEMRFTIASISAQVSRLPSRRLFATPRAH